MQKIPTVSQEMLTARQVQELLHIDRSTVYRMAGDGRLPAIRIGRQLRFPADRLGGLVGEGQVAERELDPALAEAAIEVAADLLGVSMVVTDMAGRPVTGIVNPSARFSDRDDALGECLDHWRAMADDSDLGPRFIETPMGFECARAFIRSGPRLIGMVLVGGVAPEGSSSENFHMLDAPGREAVLRALPRIAATLGRSAQSVTQEKESP